jgi:phenylacetate-coenzyme A ligase PaaK-like adenylate-forming protein
VGIPGACSQFWMVIDRKRHKLDEIHIRVELTERDFTGELKDLGEVKCSVVWGIS